MVTAEDLIHRGADERLEPREAVWKENFWISFLGPKGQQRDKAEGRTAIEVMTTQVHSVEPDMHPQLHDSWWITILPLYPSWKQEK